MTSDLVKLQLAWLEQGMTEFESHVRMQSYIDSGMNPQLAAAAASAELHQDDIADLYTRVEHLEKLVAMLIENREG